MQRMIRYFFGALGSEIQKSRRTLALWLTALYPLFTVSLVGLSHINAKFGDDNPWTRYTYNISEVGSFFLPFFLVLIIGFYCHIEHKSNTWKHLLSMPVPKWSLYTGKLATIFILLFLSFCLFIVFGYLISFAIHLISPNMTFLKGYINPVLLFKLLIRMYLSGFFIISIQYLLSLHFKNIIIPLIIGLAFIILPVAIMIIMGISGLINDAKTVQNIFSYDPYSYPFTHSFKLVKESAGQIQVFPRMSLYYVLGSLPVFIIGFFMFSKRNRK